MALIDDYKGWTVINVGFNVPKDLTFAQLDSELKGNWVMLEDRVSYYFLFEQEQDALLFALRWL